MKTTENTEVLDALIRSGFPMAQKSQMFGKPCYKVNGKAFVCQFEQELVFKLPEDQVSQALVLTGGKLFDPSGSNRPMKAWVQVPHEAAGHHGFLANLAYHFLLSETSK